MEKTTEAKVCQREYMRNYMAEYRKKNPEKIKEIIFKCWQKKIERIMNESVG